MNCTVLYKNDTKIDIYLQIMSKSIAFFINTLYYTMPLINQRGKISYIQYTLKMYTWLLAAGQWDCNIQETQMTLPRSDHHY